MRITHKQLETCRKDPIGWVADNISSQGSSIFLRNFDQCLEQAVFQFHKTRQADLSKVYLENRMKSAKFSDVEIFEDTRMKLNSYIAWFVNSGVTVAGGRFLLSMDLGSDITLGGFIGRIDLTQNGYRAILLENIMPAWDEDLRMPLIQIGIAKAFGRPINEVSVGIQELDASNLVVCCFKPEELATASHVAQYLSNQISRELSNYA